VLCLFNDNRYKKFCHSFIAFLGEEHLDEILRAFVMQSPFIMCGGLYEDGLGKKKKILTFYIVQKIRIDCLFVVYIIGCLSKL
jgi:hypothetical protein